MELKTYQLMLAIFIPFVVIVSVPGVSSQPFLNSLAVLFRSRPPWPTTFPSSKFTGFPNFLTGQHSPAPSATPFNPSAATYSGMVGPHHGILVAQPLTSGTQDQVKDLTTSASVATETKNNLEGLSYPHGSFVQTSVSTAGQQGAVQLNSLPVISTPVPMHAPPLAMYPGANQLMNIRTEGQPGGGSSHSSSSSTETGSKSGPKTLSDLPNLVTSPSSINGNVVFPMEPPTALSNPFFGMLYDHNMKPVKYPHQVGQHRPKKHKGRKYKPGFRLNPWNPFPTHMIFNHLHHGNRENLVPNSSNEKEVVHENNSEQQRLRKQKKLKDFRPSPQISSFLETTVISDYNTHTQANNAAHPVSYMRPASSTEDKDKYTSFEATDVKTAPKFESGFRPISGDQYAANYGTTATRPYYTNSQTQYFNPWSIPYDSAHQPRNESSIETSQGSSRDERKIASVHIAPETDKASEGTEEELTTSEEEYNPLMFFKNRGKIQPQSQSKKEKTTRHSFSSKAKYHHGVPATVSSTTASSELVEEWLPPGIRIEKKSDGKQKKFHNYDKKITQVRYPNNHVPKGLIRLPDKCDKFKKYGFCPVTRQYPLEAAERIASRCSALLSHLIAPLPKVDVQYEVGSADTSNSSSSTSRSWTWQTFEGKPVCDTDEITTVPGWAKNENGDWMIILQTKLWQQKAHISLCSPVARSCEGSSCPKKTTVFGHQNLNPKLLKDHQTGAESLQETKCVQRFTAQRLAVFDPENYDRCPVVRSVFLPSACVCLSKALLKNSTDENRSAANYPIRQPLFASLNEEILDEFDESREDVKASIMEELSLPHRSQESLGEEDPTPAVTPLPITKLPRFRVIRRKKSRLEETKEAPRPVYQKNQNATYMIISETYSTNEASPELPPEGDMTALESSNDNNDADQRSTLGDFNFDLDNETEEMFKNTPTIITSVKVNRH